MLIAVAGEVTGAGSPTSAADTNSTPSASPQAREQFANLARTWIRLADELERTLAFIDALEEETEAQRRTG